MNLFFKIYPLFFRILNKIEFSFRIWKFRLLGMKIGKKSFIGKVDLSTFNNVIIGDFCTIENYSEFRIFGDSKTTCIIIHDNVFIGSSCHFNIGEQIIIGSNSMIASGCSFIDNDHGTGRGQLLRTQLGKFKSILIEDDCWLGANVIVLKGVTIGKGAIVAAGAVVNKNIPPYEIWGGIPAKKIGERK